MGSSTSSNRGGSTPFFLSPKSSTVNLQQSGTTPFASLSECPFTETEGPAAMEAQHQTQSYAHTQPAPTPASQQQQAQLDSQVHTILTKELVAGSALLHHWLHAEVVLTKLSQLGLSTSHAWWGCCADEALNAA